MNLYIILQFPSSNQKEKVPKYRKTRTKSSNKAKTFIPHQNKCREDPDAIVQVRGITAIKCVPKTEKSFLKDKNPIQKPVNLQKVNLNSVWEKNLFLPKDEKKSLDKTVFISILKKHLKEHDIKCESKKTIKK